MSEQVMPGRPLDGLDAEWLLERQPWSVGAGVTVRVFSQERRGAGR